MTARRGSYTQGFRGSLGAKTRVNSRKVFRRRKSSYRLSGTRCVRPSSASHAHATISSCLSKTFNQARVLFLERKCVLSDHHSFLRSEDGSDDTESWLLAAWSNQVSVWEQNSFEQIIFTVTAVSMYPYDNKTKFVVLQSQKVSQKTPALMASVFMSWISWIHEPPLRVFKKGLGLPSQSLLRVFVTSVIYHGKYAKKVKMFKDVRCVNHCQKPESGKLSR